MGQLCDRAGEAHFSPHFTRYSFFNKMKVGHIVLVVERNFPMAICRVVSDYQHTEHLHTLGIWCHHFRDVCVLQYYLYYPNCDRAVEIATSSNIQRMMDQESEERQLTVNWLRDLEEL